MSDKRTIQLHRSERGQDLGEWRILAINLEAKLEVREKELEKLRSALVGLRENPWGCPFCDSGKLRREDRPHNSDCPFVVADMAIEDTVGRAAGEHKK